jgi:hypothetical protein
MKKSKRPAATSKRKGNAAAVKAAAANTTSSRRDILRLAGYGSLGALALGGGGVWVVSGIRATAAEQDLGRIGDGQRAIVQIHDPTCSMCTELQRNTRRALRCVEGAEPLYLVASMLTTEGATYAARHGVSHVTLLLLDGAGDVEQVLSGVRGSDELKPIFQHHFSRA